MLGNIISLIIGLVIGLLIGWYYWGRRISEQEAEARRLQASVREKERSMQGLDASLKEQTAKIEQLQSQVGQSEATTHDLTAQADDQKQTIGQLEGVITSRDGQVQELRARAEVAEARVGELEASLQEKERLAATPIAEAAPPVAEEPQVSVTEPSPDNLKRIEGIGPTLSRVLQDAGITTFAQLADTDIGRLEQILGDAGMTLADPTTWPEQARLAAAGDWEALDALQDELKGGRQV